MENPNALKQVHDASVRVLACADMSKSQHHGVVETIELCIGHVFLELG